MLIISVPSYPHFLSGSEFSPVMYDNWLKLTWTNFVVFAVVPHAHCSQARHGVGGVAQSSH